MIARLAFLRWVFLGCPLLLVVSALPPRTAGETPFNHTTAFDRVWARADGAVAAVTANRAWRWGPAAISPVLDEPYAGATGGRRRVQYFDKARMELAGQEDTSRVTTGLLVVELMTGRIQVGDDAFVGRDPSVWRVVGDQVPGSSSPTYADLARVRDAARLAAGAAIRQTIGVDGGVGDDGPDGVTAIVIPEVDHAVASVFWTFLTTSGPVTFDEAIAHGLPSATTFDDTGLPITEAYWVTATIDGQPTSQLLQAFERRVLTYTPTHQAGSAVEFGDVGRHYYAWRYGQQPPAAGEDQPDLIATMLAAGDIADCGALAGARATAALLDGLDGTIAALGDLAYPAGTPADYAHCYEPTWGRHRARTRPTPGNHDYRSSGAAGYFAYFPAAAGPPERGYYSYDLGAWHIIVLNSNCAAVGCAAGGIQELWLRADLAAHPTRCTLAYWHHPRYSSGPHGSDPATQALWTALYEHGADVVLTGHDHTYERLAPLDAAGRLDPARGIRQFVVGTGGTSHYGIRTPLSVSEAHSDDTFGVLKLTLEPTGYRWAFVPVAGQTFTDTGQAACHGRG